MDKRAIRLRLVSTAAAAVTAGLLTMAVGGGSAYAGEWMSGEYHTHTGESKDATEEYMSLDNTLAAAFRNQSQISATQARYPNSHIGALQNGEPYDYLFLANHLRRSSTDTTKGGGSYTTPFYKAVQSEQQSLQSAIASTYAGKIVYSGFEWDAPGLDHVSVGLIDSNSDAVPYEGIHEFEWKYAHASGSNANDGDDPTAMYDNGGTAEQQKWGDRLGDSDVQHTYDALRWIKENYPDSYVLPNHLSRHGEGAADSFTIDKLRIMNDIAPDNVFGFEGMPGNEMSGSKRGELPASYAGADKAIAQTGGTWDALLSEGRHIWNFANADFHFKVSGNGRYSSGYWPSEYSRNYTYVNDTDGDGYDVKDVVAGLRSGNSFSTYGDIIDKLDFKVASNGKSATMGQTLTASKTDPLTITIRFHVPAKNNYQKIGSTDTGIDASDTPKVDHVDLIRGTVTGKVDEADYASEANTDAKIIKTFSKDDLGEPDADGYYTLTFTDTVENAVYYRIRGVSSASVDQNGDPVADAQYDTKSAPERFDYINDQNYASYSFYANPVFVDAQDVKVSYVDLERQVEDAIAQFDKETAASYTAESFAAYRATVEQVRKLVATGDATRDELQSSLDAMAAAKAALVAASSKPDGGNGNGHENGSGAGGNDSGTGDGKDDEKPAESGAGGDGATDADGEKSSGRKSGDASGLPQTGDNAAGEVLVVTLAGLAVIATGAGVALVRRRDGDR